MKALLIFLLFVSFLEAKQLVKPVDAIVALYLDANVQKKSLLLTKKQLQSIEKKAKTKLKSKIVRYYTIKTPTTRAVAIVMVQKVRTKKAAILYIIEDGAIKDIEIIAFSEPPEYIPPKSWQQQFYNKSLHDNLQVGETISASSGATLSARAVTKGARAALAITKELGL